MTSTISTQLRVWVQVINFLILSYLFFKRYGLEVSRYPRIPNLVVALLSLVFVSMIVSTTFSNYPVLGIEQIIRMTLFLLLIYFIFALIESNIEIKTLIFAFIIVGLFYSITIIVDLALNNFNLVLMEINQLKEENSGYINMNTMGAFFVLIISILMCLLFGDFKRSIKKIFLFLLIIFVLSLLFTNSRAAILSIVISFLFIFYKLNKKILKWVLISVIIVIPFYFISSIQEFVDLYFRLGYHATSGRDFILDVITNVITHNPIVGYGPAATKFALYYDLPFMLGSPAEKFIFYHYNEIEFGHAHNFYLFFWSDLGLLGLFTSLFLPYIYFKLCYKTLQRLREDKNHYFLILGLTAAGLGLFIRGFFEWSCLISYGTINTDLPFWIMLIMIIYFYNKKEITEKKILTSNNA